MFSTSKTLAGAAALVLAISLNAPAQAQDTTKNGDAIKGTVVKTADPFKDAVALYNSGDYSSAVPAFEALKGSAKGDLSRYYLALSLQQQNQIKAAKGEYMYLYYKAKDKDVRFKAWQALKNLGADEKPATGKNGGTKMASQPAKGPGADAWITPTEGYGRSGPEATSSIDVKLIPTSCGRRHR